ncbi:hypothetical protein FS837_004241 [Tulasnella sp. UAMH 9824]|nr:hypothetical protein FS837_004241 [Tulasnella sp. UAMH 9824]
MQASSDESRVLVIYTGGTIGMLVGNEGFVPEPFFLTESLRKESRFHDPNDDSLFSRATSVQNFRTWHSRSASASASSPSTPTRSPSPSTTPLPAAEPPLPTLLVRSSRPIAQPPEYIGTGKHLSWKINPDCWEAHLPSLITPKVQLVHGTTKQKRIRYAILEWQPLLDSSNMEYSDWIRIATEIELNYSNFDAFVILHGTDTMGYTSSALSFLLEDLGKTVIITGAQIPLSQLRNDAVDNLLGALTIAGQFIIPECCLYFNHTLFRGNRVTKSSSYDLDAFSSPNFPPLVNVGIDIVVNWNQVLRPKSQKKFRAHKVALRLFPGITATTVRSFLAPHIQGVILESYGAGNAPGRKDMMDVLKEACDRGVVIVTISQCAKGTVSDSYETGRTLLNAGVVAGGDMTAPCALTKLAYLLSKPELSVAQVRELIKTPLRGEMTTSTSLTNSASPGLESVSELLSQVLRISSTPSSALPPTSSSTAPPLISITSSLASNTTSTPQDTKTAKDATAPWSLTASDAASTQSALLPFLIHLAAARDDVDGLKYCIEADDQLFNALAQPTAEVMSPTGAVGAGAGGTTTMTVPGGVVNCLDGATRMSPLHVAALNGCERAVSVLLQSGALVHQRDVMDHTPLYYAARQGHSKIVQSLMKAGALLSGSDVSMGYADLGLRRAKGLGDEEGLKIWETVQPPKQPHHHHSADSPKEDNGETKES